MSSEPIIQAEGVGKKYRLRQGVAPYASLRETLVESMGRLTGRAAPAREAPDEFWALQDVRFDVARGEVVGIIGRNGAGKSTLLKILSRITEPTTGRITLEGRVASLLEVGTGFHPELTGRENIYLNGAILGMSRAEITRKFDRIVDFAEVERFLDMPVKRYSSGMYVRLAFAVAAHLDPEILIVDEVLSVGDAEFQKKCLGAMSDVASRRGRTVLFVSHNMRAVQDLCHSAMVIDAGRVAFRGEASQAVRSYLASCEAVDEWRPVSRDGTRPFQLLRVGVAGGDGGEPQYDAEIVVTVDYRVVGPLAANRLAFNIRNDDGVVIFTSLETDAAPSESRRYAVGAYSAKAHVPARLLAPGKYYVSVSEPTAEGDNAIFENILSFIVGDRGSPTLRCYRPGLIAPTLDWTTTELSA